MKRAPNVDLREVEWRVDGKPTQDSRCRFVPYVDASTTAALLDEWVGPGNWRDKYESGTVAGKEVMWCHLSIRTDDGWVTKTDLGIPTNFEGQKGAVSDAFKRAACLKWGIARNVYSLPTLWAPCRVDNKGNAWPSDQTIPSILGQLERAGYEANGARVQVEEVSTGSASAEPKASEVQPSPSSGPDKPAASQSEMSPNSWGEEETGGSAASESRPSSSSPEWQEIGDRYGKAVVLRTARDIASGLDVSPLPGKFDDLAGIQDGRVLEATAEALAERLVKA